MHDLHNLKEMLCDALCEYGKRDTLTQNSLQMIDTLAHACKNVCKIMESGDCEEYSYSRNDIVKSGGGSEMARRLREMMCDTTDDGVRAELRHLADKIESI